MTPSPASAALGSPTGTIAPPWIKVCGIRDAELGSVAVDSGANVLGCVLAAGSPRQVSLTRALSLADRWKLLPCAVVAVVLDLSDDDPLLDQWDGPIQVHGSICERAMARLLSRGLPVIVAGPDAGSRALLHGGLTIEPAARLLDHATPGSGVAQDWHQVACAIAPFRHHAIVAGGLRPDNVAEAIRETTPAGVDASSGLESERGTKCKSLVRGYCLAAVEAFRAARR